MKTWLWLMLVLFMVVGCGGKETEPLKSVIRKETVEVKHTDVYDMDVIVTVGSHSYIHILKKGTPADNAKLILTIKQKFEEKHPEWEITNWQIEKEQSANEDTSLWVYGLWADHRPRPGYVPKPEKE